MEQRSFPTRASEGLAARPPPGMVGREAEEEGRARYMKEGARAVQKSISIHWRPRKASVSEADSAP